MNLREGQAFKKTQAHLGITKLMNEYAQSSDSSYSGGENNVDEIQDLN